MSTSGADAKASKTSITAWISLALSLIALFLSWTNSKSTLHAQFREALVTLSSLERDGSQQADLSHTPGGGGGCGGSEPCLGNLAFKKSYRDQYQLVTAEAVELAKTLEEQISQAELFQLSHALYMSGDLATSSAYADKPLKGNPVFQLKFRTKLLQAQIAFFQRNMDVGNARIRDAHELISSQQEISKIEQHLLEAEAELVCANMHAAVGLWDDGKKCLSHAYENLVDLPETVLTLQLRDVARDQLKSIVMAKKNLTKKTFDGLEKEVNEEVEKESKTRSGDETAPAAPASARPAE